MGQYDKQVDMALRLIQAKGRSITVLEPVDGDAPDPTKRWKIQPGDPNRHLSFGVFLDYTSKEMQDGRIMEGDVKVLLPAKGLTIELTTKMKIERTATQVYTIKRIKRLEPGDQLILYELQCREG